MTTPQHAAALQYQAAGLSVIPILPADPAGDKRPAVAWRPYIDQPASRGQINAWWGQQDYGIGIAMGTASGNLMMIELEGRAAGSLQELADLATQTGLTTLWNRVIPGGAVEQSPSGGIHIYLHVDLQPDETLPGNQKLARQPNPDHAGTPRVLVLAETRGQGGYSVVAPTDGRFHHTGQPWTVLTGSIANAPHVTLPEYKDLCQLFATLDTMPTQAPIKPAQARSQFDGVTPGDDFEAKTPWNDILTPHGWTPVYTRGSETFWRRPGKTAGISASTGHAGDRDRLYIWSTSTEFDSETPYTKLGAYAILNHAGDMSKAAKTLYDKGYGKQAEHPRDVIDDLAEVYGPKDELAAPEEAEPTAAAADPAPILDISEPTIYTRTDDGNALRFVDTYPGQLCWIPEKGTWASWNGHQWDADNGNAKAIELAKALARSLPEDDKADEAHKKKSLSRNGITNMIELARTSPTFYTPLADFDADPWMLNTPAGPVNLHTGTITKPDPKRRFLRATSIAPDTSLPHPVWDRFLDETFTGDTHMISFIQRLLGLSLIGEVREQIFPFMHGAGANGKTTLLNAVQHILGRGSTGYSSNIQAEVLLASASNRHPTEIADLAGVRVAIASELEEGQKFAEARIKLLTGKDAISARFMRQDFFTFTPSHTLFLLGNYEPEVRAGGSAFWRRMLKIPFLNIVPKENRDPGLEDKLAEESAGILAWMIQGCRQYTAGGLDEPESVRVATNLYERDQDTVNQFLEECCTTGEPTRQDLHVRISELRSSYEAWCREAGFDSVTAKSFTQRLRTHGITTSRTMSARFYDGVRLADHMTQSSFGDPWSDLGGGR
jgi:putative DNA primase/helicase